MRGHAAEHDEDAGEQPDGQGVGEGAEDDQGDEFKELPPTDHSIGEQWKDVPEEDSGGEHEDEQPDGEEDGLEDLLEDVALEARHGARIEAGFFILETRKARPELFVLRVCARPSTRLHGHRQFPSGVCPRRA